MNFELTDQTVSELSRPLAQIIIEFYKYPENERKFQEWLKQNMEGKKNG